MKIDPKAKTQPAETAENKKSFLVRMIERLDHAMKETAEKKAKQGCCGTDNNGKPCC